ncbi:TetR/AcrR family transcriptional regulator [Nakamurella lactea]|uniref:TetR/AcrR family transcriptional regulator n=1 Tax=Nakamurella lactea TaxID=459515 RepID=UPI0012B57514|nr:TetR/AcrR family transcriptional regulator [Nakamurella lactea]
MSPRARPMSPDERRQSIVTATRPLVREHGRELTTKQIAAAAGVAEGTLFRVFDDKEAILRAVVVDAIDPKPVLAEIDAMDRDAPLHELISDLVAAMKDRVQEIFQIAMAIRWMPEWAMERHVELDPVQQRIVDLLDHRRHELSVEPTTAAEVLRLLIFSSTHPMINEGRPLAAVDIVEVLLDGVRRRPAGIPSTTTAVAARRRPATAVGADSIGADVIRADVATAAPSAKTRRRRSPSANTS